MNAREIFLAGVGTAALTCEKAGEVISDLIKKGKLSVEEGKQLSEELKKNMKEKTDKASDSFMSKMNEIKPLTKESLKEALEEMKLPTKADILELKRRIEKIEAQLNIKEEVEEAEEVIFDATEDGDTDK
ncbi:MAG: phasin family protein [Clostridium sp.]|nr:phasin family protein [Clostridium sp.]MDY3828296.1 phasin family protein [Clostridium sp.]